MLTEAELNKPGCAWPWQLAARVLCGGPTLTWAELWDVIRWYAHNRGYDANRRWGRQEEEKKEDSEKVQNALALLERHSTKTMAESFCAYLNIDPKGNKRASGERFKGLQAAFPREMVEEEVNRILEAHIQKLPGVSADLIRTLNGRDAKAWQTIPCPEIQLHKRYEGGLLFGQLVPRFDNRIIAKCPVTGHKVPVRRCPEFLRFRWAMLLANIRVGQDGQSELRPLTPGARKAIDHVMRQRGSLTSYQLKTTVREITGCARDNLETMLLHPDAEEALLLDPVKDNVRFLSHFSEGQSSR